MTRTETCVPKLFSPHPHWSDGVNRNIVQSEIEGGVYLRDLRPGAVLEIETMDWICTFVYCGDCEARVSGHPKFCPEPVQVYVAGSTWGGSMLKQFFIGRGMHLEFLHPLHQRILTSPVREIREISA
ncbi:MAG TPA: hypothetical protein VKT49_02380 [Bryobacteraceae bacterium]|nr:hypothetical protein [Bryobacteraceae bacterium]